MIFACAAMAARGAAEPCNGLLFRSPVRYAVAADEVVLLADLDGDGLPEVISSGNHVDEVAVFSLLPNLGGGVFGNERQVAAGFGETLQDVFDQNHDGRPDLVASSYWQNGIATYRGSGPLQFDARMPFDTATHGGPTRAMDTNGDGLVDLVSFSFGSGNLVRVHLFRGRADGTFEPKTTFDSSLANADSPSARIRDGHLEILVSEHAGHLGLFRFTPDGISVSRLEATPGIDLTSLFVDVNEDGLADVVDTTDDGSGPFESVFVTIAKPDGSFLGRKQIRQPRQMALPTKLRAADLDGDGHVDLVLSDFRATTLQYFRGDGTGNFDQSVAVDVGGPVNDFRIGDVNGDGRPDLVTVNSDHTVSVMINVGPCSPPRHRAVAH